MMGEGRGGRLTEPLKTVLCYHTSSTLTLAKAVRSCSSSQSCHSISREVEVAVDGEGRLFDWPGMFFDVNGLREDDEEEEEGEVEVICVDTQ